MAGYTMVELITVMVLIGIISAIAAPRLLGNDMAGPAFRADLVSALRYAQKTAVSHRRLVCATLTPASPYTTVALTIAPSSNAAACQSPLLLPDGSASYTSRDAGTTATSPANPLFFQPSGTITSDGAGTAIVSGAMAIAGQSAVAIEGATGYVE